MITCLVAGFQWGVDFFFIFLGWQREGSSQVKNRRIRIEGSVLVSVFVVLASVCAMMGLPSCFCVWLIMSVNPCQVVKGTCGFSCNTMVGMHYSPCIALPALLPDELPTFATLPC